MRFRRLALGALLLAPAIFSQSEQEAGLRLMHEVRHRMRQGIPPTAEEEERIKRWQASRLERYQKYQRDVTPRDSTGLVALPDLGAGRYQGEQGGLYPGGANQMPRKHRQAGLKLAEQIQPLDAGGKPTPDGKIVFLSVGMSNTTQSFQVFQQRANEDPARNPSVIIVDGALGGNSAEVTSNPKSDFWSHHVESRLKEKGVTARQVQAIWLKQAFQEPTRPFPVEARVLYRYLIEHLHILHDRYPNLKLTYLSSRIYAGYATQALNPEPHAYESGFAVKWVVADQLAGKPELNFDPAKGAVRSPWIAWGPYLWADGVKARRDGLQYRKEDLDPNDGTHPSMAGREKVARQLLDFLKNDPTSRPWFLSK